MAENLTRAEILVGGIVQGVGFRYFVLRNAQALGLKGYTKNLYTGEVLTVAEGPKHLVEELSKKIKIGPGNSYVKSFNIKWMKPTNEFKSFEVRY